MGLGASAGRRWAGRFAGTALGAAVALAPVAGAPGAGAATARALYFPGTIEAMTAPQANGDSWVVAKLSKTKGEMYQVNLQKDTLLGYESISPETDTVAESANDTTLALGTMGGAFPAVVWYSGKTGRYSNASSSPSPVDSVLVNTAGDGIYSLRGSGTGPYSVSALGLSNGLSYSFVVPGTPVQLVSGGVGTVLVLDADGSVGTLSEPSGHYGVDFTTGGPARSMALSTDGSTMWVLHQPAGGATSISEVALPGGKVVEMIAAPKNCVGISLSADGHTLYEMLVGHGKVPSSIKAVTVP